MPCQAHLHECAQARLERRALHNVKGTLLHAIQCMECGRYTYQGVKRDDSNPPALDRRLADRYWKQLRAEKEKARRQTRKSWWAQYRDYMKSDKWHRRRAKVIERDKVCQGCLTRPIDVVHHLSYAHVFSELAFELVGLCHKCHDRCHSSPDDRPPTD